MNQTCMDCGEDTLWTGRGRPRLRCPDCGRRANRLSINAAKRARYAADPEKFKAARRDEEKRKRRCSYTGCANPQVHADGLCRSHHSRLIRTGSADGLIQRVKRDNVDSQGYRRFRVDGKMRLEHRLVMAEMIGRELLPHENVHHINGDRLDNRPENLELWSTQQPPGQRVADKVEWAAELLALYAPELLAATQFRLAI